MARLNLLICSALALAMVACSSQPTAEEPTDSEKRADIYFQAGVAGLEQKNYADALGNLNNALKYNPKSAMIWSNVGVAYASKGESERAEAAWKRALKLDPKHTDSRLNLGIFYLRAKRYAEAEQLFREAAKDLSYHQLDQVYYNLALLYLQQGKTLLAEQQLKLSVKENSSYCPSWMQLGLIQKERGDYAEAAKSLKGSVMGTCYKNPQAHYEIASLYLKAHETQLAKTKLLEIIQLFPTSEWASKSEATLNMIR